MYVSSNIGPVLFSNGAAYRNPRVDTLFDQAAAAVEKPERAKYYAEFQDIVARDMPYLGMIETDGYRAWPKKFQDLYYWSGDLAEAAWQQ
jgi:peptide/nickel transport system substrate-binding protein